MSIRRIALALPVAAVAVLAWLGPGTGSARAEEGCKANCDPVVVFGGVSPTIIIEQPSPMSSR